MFYQDYKKVEQIIWLASADFQTFTYQIPESLGEVQDDGRKIVPSGTVFPANDATAIGIVFNDVDVTHGDAPGSILVEGWIIEERLPEPVADTAKDAMKKVSFKVVNPQDVEPPVVEG